MAEPEIIDKIIESINSSPYKWRTINGISKELKLKDEVISEAVNDSDSFVRSKVPNTHGEILYTTSERYKESTSLWGRFLGAGANTVSS